MTERQEILDKLIKNLPLFNQIQEILILKSSNKLDVEWGKYICSKKNDYSVFKIKFKDGAKGIIVYYRYGDLTIKAFGFKEGSLSGLTPVVESYHPMIESVFYNCVKVILIPAIKKERIKKYVRPAHTYVGD